MKCPNCGAEVSEEDKFCGECGKTLTRTVESISEGTKFPYILVGIISAVVSLFLLPPVFGILSIFCGYKVYKQKSEGLGIGIMVLGGIFMLIGMIIGSIIWYL